MTAYTMHGVTLTKYQIQKLIEGAKNQHEVKLRLTKNNLHGNHRLPLTLRQLNRIQKTKSGIDLTLSASQLQQLESTGGFLPLLALIPAIMGGIGAAGGLAGGIASAVNAAKNAQALTAAQQETARHNRAVEEQIGKGVVANVVGKLPVIGSHLKTLLEKIGLGKCECKKLLSGESSYHLGEGLYIRPYGGGLYLGPQNGPPPAT
jgi:hypothetical protein